LSTIRAAARSILNDVVKGTHGHRGHGRQQRPTATSTTTARESKAQPGDGFSFGANPFNALTGLGGMVPPHPRLSLPKRPPTQALRFHAATSTGPCGMHPSRDVVPAGAVCHSIDTRSRCAHDGQPTHHQRSLQKDVRVSHKSVFKLRPKTQTFYLLEYESYDLVTPFAQPAPFRTTAFLRASD